MLDPFNAFLERDPEARGGVGPLAGLTVGVKANIAVKGLAWHGGLAAFKDRIATADAQTVALLRDAGAAILGTLNMEEAALGAKTDNPHFGPVQNPHKIGYSPGGSSGGSGAAVAAGLVDFALGTDTMGSVRIPASHCGVYGFKPAADRVSQQGLEIVDPSLDAIGPLARDLDLIEKVARVMSDVGESMIAGSGVTLVDHGVALHPAVAESFAKALDALEGPVARASLGNALGRIRFAGFIKVATGLADRLKGVSTSDRLAKLLAFGAERSDADRAEDEAVLARAREQMRELVARHGFAILPTVPNPPFPHRLAEPASQADFTCLANIAGLSALSLPAGWTDDGLPIGVQLMAEPGRETGLFALARAIDRKLGAYRAPLTQGES